MAKIETIYRCRIDYEWAGDSTDGGDAVVDAAFKFSYRESGVELESFDGCPACPPYLKLESANSKAVERLAGKIERYINRRKDVALLDAA